MAKVGTELRDIGYVGLGKPLTMLSGRYACFVLAETGWLAGNMGLPMAQNIARQHQLVRSHYPASEECQ